MNKELIDYLESGDDSNLHEAAELLLKQHAAIVRLRATLQWYVDEDEVMDGGKWEEENAFWLQGKRDAEAVLEATEEFE